MQRKVVTTTLVIAFVSLAKAVCADPVQRPNVILIVTDNQGPGLIGAYGNEDIRTPHLDKLAHNGAVFNSAHANSGVCSPTRATLLTGLMPSQTGVHNALPSQPKLDDWAAIREFRNLPMTLKAAGYKTALVGKYHLGRHDSAQLGFDKWVTFPSGHTEKFFDVEIIEDGKRYVTDKHLTDFWTDKATDFIADAAGDADSFFLLLTYNGPYGLPPVVNAEYENRHTRYYIENPPEMPQEPVGQNLENWAREGDPKTYSEAHGITPWAAIKALNNRLVMANLAAETTMIDDGIGAVVDALHRADVADNTIVIFTSDQGAAYGQNGLWGNSSWAWPFASYEANTRVPLIVWDNNKRVDDKQKIDVVVNQFDLFATILDLVGLEDITIKNSPGKSLAPLMVGKNDTVARDAAYFEFITVRALRTDRFRYVKRLLSGDIELYDLDVDPAEHSDVSGLPAYREEVAALDARLSTFFDEYADPDYDAWRGGAAKGRFLDGGRTDLYRAVFPEWRGVELRHRAPFNHDEP